MQPRKNPGLPKPDFSCFNNNATSSSSSNNNNNTPRDTSYDSPTPSARPTVPPPLVHAAPSHQSVVPGPALNLNNPPPLAVPSFPSQFPTLPFFPNTARDLFGASSPMRPAPGSPHSSPSR
jgi:hypothetical protein